MSATYRGDRDDGFLWYDDDGALKWLFASKKYGALINKKYCWTNLGVLKMMVCLDFDNINFKWVNFILVYLL